MNKETPMTTKQALAKALAIVEQGWTQHAWARTPRGVSLLNWEPGCSACLVEAIHITTPPYGIKMNIYDTLAHVLQRQTLTPITLMQWNDASERTQEDVIALLKTAIAICPY